MIKESEGGAEAAGPGDNEEEPYMSHKCKRIIALEKNKELGEKKANGAAEVKEAVKKAMADAEAAVAAARAGLKA